MKFTKMQGAGNDFIVINNIEENIPEEKLSEIAAVLCTRRMSVGADGFMVVTESDAADFKMLFFNSDGSVGEMCGNGARCIARYGYENGLSGDVQKIETTAGIVMGYRKSERMYTVRLNDPTTIDLHRAAEADGEEYDCSYIELGNPGLPHGIVLFDGFDEIDENVLREKGRQLRWSKNFPKGANVTFCYVNGEDSVKARTFERGVEDFTLACGTGCGSVVTALTLKGLVSGNNVKVSMPGGDLFVTVTREGDTVKDIMLTGPTNIVAEGIIRDEDLFNKGVIK